MVRLRRSWASRRTSDHHRFTLMSAEMRKHLAVGVWIVAVSLAVLAAIITVAIVTVLTG